jgi:signal peptide peptidase SppA
MNGRLVRLMTEFYRTPWALMPETLAMLKAVLHRAASGVKLSAEEIRSAVAYDHVDHAVDAADAARRTEAVRAAGSNLIAVLPVSGVIGHRAHLVEDSSSGVGTSTEILGRMFRQMVADPNVGAIVFDHDSPGGSVFGVGELADDILAARGSKPITAVVNSLSASASYWLASQADEVVITPGGMAGSIGVWSAHEDWSAYLDKKGVKTTLISAGKYKVEGNPYGPLSEEALAAEQATVDSYYAMFIDAVARGRGDKASAVRKGYGEGRVLLAADAVKANLANRVATMDQVIAGLQKKLGAGPAPQRAAEGGTPARSAAARALRLAELG